MSENVEKLRVALGQWRDSLVNMTGRNRLLNYRPTRASTIEFARHSPAEVFAHIDARGGTYVFGTKPPKPSAAADMVADQSDVSLEDEVLAEIVEFDYTSHPQNLFADKTQTEVDRTLKRLSADAKREWVDKGISVLYTAFGALKWEDNGDERRSPLILIPVSLLSDGPRQPLRLIFSEDDTSTNPAIALKLLEFGITLPTSEDVDKAMDDGGIEAALDLFRTIDYPDGWQIDDLTVLANFMFAKEAMYRDLLEHEESILENLVLQSMAGIQPEEGEELYFEEFSAEEIDELSPTESTPLVLDADSSQRAAIAAAMQGKSFVLDGPPGTGKSQTIANIIGTLIESGKKVLFVSEKAVALDVVRDRLKTRGLDPFVLELHSSKAVRREVAARLGEALDSFPVAPAPLDGLTVSEAREMRISLNGYAEAINEIRQPLNRSVHQVLGELATLRSEKVAPQPKILLDTFDAAELAAVVRNTEQVAAHWDVLVAGPHHLWWDLQHTFSLDFDIQTAADSLEDLHSVLQELAPLAETLALGNLDDGAALHTILSVWHAGSGLHDHDWLVLHATKTLDELIIYIDRLIDTRDRALEQARADGGEAWQDLPATSAEHIPLATTELLRWWPDAESSTIENFLSRSAAISYASASLLSLQTTVTTVATALGFTVPSNTDAVAVSLDAAAAATAEEPPLSTWISADAIKKAEKNAAELKAYWFAEQDAQSAATRFFSEDILDADVDGLESRFAKNHGLLAKLSKEFKADKTEVSRLSKVVFKVALQNLSLAAQWRAAHRRRTTAEAEDDILGSYYEGAATNWDRVERALQAGRTLLNAGVISDFDKLARQLDSQSMRAIVRNAAAAASTALKTWTDLSLGDSAIPALLTLGEFFAASKWLNQRAMELDTLKEFLQPLTGTLSDAVTLEKAVVAITARRSADESIASVAAGRETMERELGTAAFSGLELTAESIAAFRTKLTWTVEFRRTMASLSVSRTDNDLLTEVEWEALAASYLPAALETLSARWSESRARVRGAFGARRQSELGADFSQYDSASSLLLDFAADKDGRAAWFEASTARAALAQLGFAEIVDYAVERGIESTDAVAFVMSAFYRFWTDHFLASDSRFEQYRSMAPPDIVARFRDLDHELVDGAVSSIIRAATSRRPKSNFGQSSIIRHEAEKKKRHIPVRQLVASARDVIQAIHPCFMMSPLAVSQYLPSDLTFDVVIFDEASQVTPGDAINCIYRGRSLIAAGDQRQLPPTSFFMTSLVSDEDTEEEDLATDYESVLDLMKSSGRFTTMTLRWHYRSRHEHLIAYSNASFYNGRLITFPSAIDMSDDMGVKCFHVDGTYRRSAGQDNPVEAMAVADRVIHHFETRPNQSLGVVAFSAAQRDTIENALTLARASRPELERFFDDDRVDGFFIKSLEYVQGDERDVMIFSIGYGPDEQGKVYKNFSALNRQGGERRLNVAITRARELVEVVTSMSAAQLGDVSSEGARHLRRYLDFAERGPVALSLELGDEGLGTDSPFEDSVIDAIRSWGFDIQPQVGVAGYRIDIGVKHPNTPGAFMLGVECDGAMYHSSRSARDRDRLRHELLEGLGWRIHHIWGTSWYRNREREMGKLKARLEALAQEPMSGRTPSVNPRRRREPVELEFGIVPMTETPEWAVPYTLSYPTAFPRWLDLADHTSAHRLSEFVREVAEVEAPIHIDTLSARLRQTAGIGRIGNRIAMTFEHAIKMSGLNFDGSFLHVGDEYNLRVRMPADGVERSIDEISDAELSIAIRHSVNEAAGASRDDVITRVSSVFGWRRKSAAMSGRIDGLIDTLLRTGELEESSAGLRAQS